MMSGSSKPLLRLIVAFALCVGAGSPLLAAQPQSAWTVDRLMDGLSKIKSARSNYTEDQYIDIVKAPLHSSGELVYVAPNRLEKNTLKPTPQSIVIDGDRLTMRQGRGRPRTVMLSDHPEIGAFIESLRSTLSGDLTSLNRFYEVRFEGTEDRWRLTLEPKGDEVKKLVKTVRIEGSHYDLLSVEIVHSDGDRSVMTMVKN